jgi:hypothetical protein
LLLVNVKKRAPLGPSHQLFCAGDESTSPRKRKRPTEKFSSSLCA